MGSNASFGILWVAFGVLGPVVSNDIWVIYEYWVLQYSCFYFKDKILVALLYRYTKSCIFLVTGSQIIHRHQRRIDWTVCFFSINIWFFPMLSQMRCMRRIFLGGCPGMCRIFSRECPKIRRIFPRHAGLLRLFDLGSNRCPGTISRCSHPFGAASRRLSSHAMRVVLHAVVSNLLCVHMVSPRSPPLLLAF